MDSHFQHDLTCVTSSQALPKRRRTLRETYIDYVAASCLHDSDRPIQRRCMNRPYILRYNGQVPSYTYIISIEEEPCPAIVLSWPQGPLSSTLS